jgi:hypothetical protein
MRFLVPRQGFRGIIVVAFVLSTGGCKAKESKHHAKQVKEMSAMEVQRGQDACKVYVEHVCSCAAQKPELAKECDLAKALPQAIEISLSVAANPDSKPDIVEQSYANVRKTVGTCIEQTAKLPAAGCN